MKTIDEIQSELRALALELEQLKQSNDAAENLTADFKKLSANGYRYPITPHPLESFDEHASKCYLTVLLTVAQFEPEMLSESLLLTHRIAFGMNYLGEGDDLQEEFAAAQTLTFSQLDEITSLFRETDERLMLILECLLTAGAFDKGRQEAFKYIAELAVLLNVDKEQLVFLSNMAAVILTGDLEQYKCEIYNNYGSLFECYLKSLDLMKIIYANDLPDYYFEKVMSKEKDKIVLNYNLNYGETEKQKPKEKMIEIQVDKGKTYVLFHVKRIYIYDDEHDHKPLSAIGVIFSYLCDGSTILDFYVENGGCIYTSLSYGNYYYGKIKRHGEPVPFGIPSIKYAGVEVKTDKGDVFLFDDVINSGLIKI